MLDYTAHRESDKQQSAYLLRPSSGRGFDLHPDGERIAGAFASLAPTDAKQDHVTLIFNFFDELRRIAPRQK